MRFCCALAVILPLVFLAAIIFGLLFMGDTLTPG